MIPKRLVTLNAQRKTIRLRMASDAKKYTVTSGSMLLMLEKLAKKDLETFIRRNPDVLVDISGGLAVKAGKKAKAVAMAFAKELEKEFKLQWAHVSEKSGTKAKEAGAMLKAKGVDYLKNILSL